jgi:hypothetical protein
MSRYLLIGLALALLMTGVLSACRAEVGISILPAESDNASESSTDITPTLLLAVVLAATVVVAVAGFRL